MSRALEERIGAATARQHGVASFAQLLDAGLSRSAISRRVGSGRLRRLHRGVYLAAPFPLPHTGEMAAVLACGPGAVLSHLSGIAFWGLPARTADGAIDVGTEVHRMRRPGIRIHHLDQLRLEDWTVKDGIPVTTPARCLLDLAPVLSADELEQLAARAERAGLVTREALQQLAGRIPGHRGVRALRTAVQGPGGPALSRSEAERRLLALIREAGLPRPVCNASFGRYELDFYWPSSRLAVEVDGYRYHASRDRFESDRRRDAQLAASGISVIRLSRRQITEHALATAVQLGQALARA